jgi:hypothetical protein
MSLGFLFRLAALSPLLALSLYADVRTAETAETIIAKSVQANERDWHAEPQYSYTQTTKDSTGTKTYEVTMLFGSPYKRLVRVNGEPLSPQERDREQQKFNEALARRRSQSKGAAAQRVSEYEKERHRDRLMMQQLTKAFRFTLTGESELSGRHVYVLRADPRPDYRPPNMEAHVLSGMKGELWIDKDSFQWVRVIAHVISPVNIGGFIATVEPGTYFELEKGPVTDQIWLPTHFKTQSQSKVIKIFHHATQEEETYSDYRLTPHQYLVQR